MTLRVSRSISSTFCRVSIELVFSNVFLIISQRLWFLKRKLKKWSIFLLFHIKDMWYACDNVDDVNLGHVVKIVFARFLLSKVTILLIPYPALWKWVSKSQPHSKSGVGKSPHKLLGILLLGDFSLLPHLLFYSTIYVCLYEWIHILYYNPLLWFTLLFKLLTCFFDKLHPLILGIFPYSLVLEDAPSTSCIFPNQPQSQPFSKDP